MPKRCSGISVKVTCSNEVAMNTLILVRNAYPNMISRGNGGFFLQQEEGYWFSWSSKAPNYFHKQPRCQIHQLNHKMWGKKQAKKKNKTKEISLGGLPLQDRARFPEERVWGANAESCEGEASVAIEKKILEMMETWISAKKSCRWGMELTQERSALSNGVLET